MTDKKPETKEAVLAELYEMIADKTLSFGCKVKLKGCPYDEQIESERDKYEGLRDKTQTVIGTKDRGDGVPLYITDLESNPIDEAWYKIIGHEPTIHDLVKAFAERWGWSDKIGVVVLVGRLENCQRSTELVEKRNEMIKALWILENFRGDFDNQELETLVAIRDLLKTKSQ